MKKNILFLASIVGVVSLYAADGNQSLQGLQIAYSPEVKEKNRLTAHLVALLMQTQEEVNQKLFLGYCPIRPLHPAASKSSLATEESFSGSLPFVEKDSGTDTSSLSSMGTHFASNGSSRSLSPIQDGDKDENFKMKPSVLEVAARSSILDANQIRKEEDSL